MALSACAGNGGGGAACGPVTREPLDPSYLVHVLPGAVDVDYLSDPPTSGPHQPGPAVEGVLEEPLPAPVQVGVLESGAVLIQHRGDLSSSDRSRLEALAGPDVVVAPSPDLPDEVVATAWTYKRSCSALDVPALREFIEERAGQGPEG